MNQLLHALSLSFLIHKIAVTGIALKVVTKLEVEIKYPCIFLWQVTGFHPMVSTPVGNLSVLRSLPTWVGFLISESEIREPGPWHPPHGAAVSIRGILS